VGCVLGRLLNLCHKRRIFADLAVNASSVKVSKDSAAASSAELLALW
jgi:hypothetical protein